MDYKLLRKTIVICSFAVLVILAAVLWRNRFSGEKTKSRTDGLQTAAGVQSGNSGDKQYVPSADFRAFLRDENFWDEEPVIWQPEEDGSIPLSLIVTSVQHDMRLYVTDPAGKIVTGEPFFIKIDEVGEYKDLDRDGMIYVRDLSAGDYHVSIMPIEGYHVAASGTNVHVRDRLEYKTIEDINLLIRSESDIDIDADALKEHDLAQDCDATEHIGTMEGPGESVMGIDVSSFNQDIDWNRVRAAGIEFAIIRCGFRGYSSGTLVEDAKFQRNVEGAAKAGVKVGIYFFTQAVNEVEAVEEASMVITLCRGHQVDLPVFIDTEGTGGNGRADALDVETRSLVCRAFCETIENAGYRAGIYASKNWFLNNLNEAVAREYLIWLAEYKEKATYTGSYQFWQYTSHGYIDGVPGRVDLNIGSLELDNLNDWDTGSEVTPPEATVTPLPFPEVTVTETPQPQSAE